MTPDDARAMIITLRELTDSGVKESQIRRDLRAGELIRLHPGRFVLKATWDSCRSEGRHMLRVIAADAARRDGDVVFSHSSAAVAWTLPLFRLTPAHVHTSGRRTDAVARPRTGVAHHGVDVPPEDRAVRGGVPVTSLERTVFDILRTESRETALAIADAAFRLVAYEEAKRIYDVGAAEIFRAAMRRRIASAPGARGIRQARFMVGFADGRADGPLESVSRLYLIDLGFAAPRLQVPFPGPKGEEWEIDLGLADVGAWGEVDGLGKYQAPEMLQGRTTADVVLAEKMREDWIRGRSQWKFARWGAKHVVTAQSLQSRLAQFHIHPPH
jgi:hypothetical protein